MITELKIENYKSIQDLTLDVGRVNVLIGENGCGKSNILEAITFAAAAEANKLDNEFLAPRGIRVTEPELMRSAFESSISQKQIEIVIGYAKSNVTEKYTLIQYGKSYIKWIRQESISPTRHIEMIPLSENRILLIAVINENEIFNEIIRAKNELSASFLQELSNHINSTFNGKDFNVLKKLVTKELKSDSQNFKKYMTYYEDKNKIKEFMIFSPENSTLRNFEKEGQIQPLGIYGEGLFKLLTVIQKEVNQSQNFTELNDIHKTLELFDWFESIKIPNDYSQLEQKIPLQDRYLEIPFDQRSANEGFLLVLFYITLVVSKYTPKIFAIDNIDTSLNPKLCTKLIKELTRLAIKYDKQLFITSHNPAILDGIDLGDDEQRLFVVSRNKQGHTRCKRIDIKDKPKSSVRDRLSRVFNDNETYTKEDILNKFDNSEEPLKLSEAFLRGYLGGLPKGF